MGSVFRESELRTGEVASPLLNSDIGESSSGRTADSGSAYRGSNPLSPANKKS